MNNKNGHSYDRRAKDLAAFPLEVKMSMPQRVAHLLDWWAARHPHDFLQYNEITKGVNGTSAMPRMDTKQVEQTRGIVSRSGKTLFKLYQRAIIRKRDLGARASVDAEDVIRHRSVKKSAEIKQSIIALAQLDELVDLNTVPNTSDVKAWYKKDVRAGFLKQLSAPENLARMLPPPPDEEP